MFHGCMPKAVEQPSSWSGLGQLEMGYKQFKQLLKTFAFGR